MAKSKSSIGWTADASRTQLTFTSTGTLQARVGLQVAGTLGKPPESLPLADATLSDHDNREACGLGAYERLRDELVGVTRQLEEAEAKSRTALERYTAAVAQGVAVGEKQEELHKARASAAEIREQHELLLDGATEARGVAVKGLDELLRDRKSETLQEAKQRYDAALADIAEAIAERLPELAAARAAWNGATHVGADAKKLVAPLPERPACDELAQQPSAEAYAQQVNASGMYFKYTPYGSA